MAIIAISEKDSLNLKPIVSFGLITDIHYSDSDDRWNYAQTFIRHYRNSLNLVDQACNYWLNGQNPVSFVIQLGDIIDGLCRTNKTSSEDLQKVLQKFKNISSVYHIWGNHELYNFSRNELLNGPLCSFDTKTISPNHYGTFLACPNLRIIAIDTYELSVLGIDENSDTYMEAISLLKTYNNNENINDPTGLEGYQQRFIKLNGGLTVKQLSWLKEELMKARNLHEKVIVIGKK